MTIRPVSRRAALLGTFVLLAASCVVLAASPAAATMRLVGTFTIAPGSCSGGVSGSYIRMILPSGGPSGPYMSNSDSTCGDQSYTLLRPGRDGGLLTGGYQSPPSPAFDSTGDALADRITAPANFYGTNFATGTSGVDPQTGVAVPVPRVTNNGGRLSADLRAFAVTWNNQNFNQGAPKPDGSFPGNTRSATGSYDAATGAYTLQWTSQVVGGPFDKFTGQWHLTGRFVPRGSGGSGGAARSGGGDSGGGGAGSGGSGGRGSAHRRSVTQPAGAGSGSAGAGEASIAVAGGGPSSSDAPARGSGNAPPATASPVASTTTVSKQEWRVSWWLVALAVAFGAAGLVALLAINRRLRAGASSGEAS